VAITVEDSESESDSEKQDVYGVIIEGQLRKEMPLDGDECETVTDASTKFDKPYVKAGPPVQGDPALRLEQLDKPYPNFFHGRLAHVVRELLELHFGVERNACDLHKLLMSLCCTEWGQYNKPKIIEDCVHVLIEQAAGKSPRTSWLAVRNEIEVAVRAISDWSPKVLLDYEVQHWKLLGRYRPQQALMAHAMAGGGKYGDFCNPKFVQQWSHFVYSVLNKDPQFVHNELRRCNYQSLICDYERVEEGIMYWEVTGASRARP
jgi:hypothetical protein